MSEMIERCAQAIRVEGHVIANPANYQRLARVVLQAALQPTMAMKLAGAPKVSAQMPRVGVQADYDAAHDAWVAMMTEALAKDPTP